LKNFRRIAYVVVIIIIVILSYLIYSNANSGEEDLKDKAVSEFRYFESKLVDLLNTMNNIEFRNYKIFTDELSKETTEKVAEGTSSETPSEKGQSEGGKTESSAEETEDSKKYELELKGVLTSKEEIDWDNIKSQVEILYASIPAMTIDLYQLNVNQEYILEFNRSYDQLAIAVKNEDKEKTLENLTNVYSNLQKILTSFNIDNLYNTLVETKVEIFRAYSKLDGGNWEEIGNDVKRAIEVYSKLLTDTSINENNQYVVSKCYIMLNELQSAVEIEDIEIFLIKYKNLLEEIQNV